ncbi:AP2/ERF family transcription factor [Acetivibrio cellulolyticus]|nr:hypothetical protein [Acetivibrio cellulolyticus]
MARITYCRKTYYKRRFDRDIEEALAYDNMAFEFHGENARFNFPRG